MRKMWSRHMPINSSHIIKERVVLNTHGSIESMDYSASVIMVEILSLSQT